MFVKPLRMFFLILLRIYNRLKVEGAENIPANGPVIIAANHISYIDPPVLAIAINRLVTFIAKHEVFECPVLRPILKSWAIPVRREAPRPSDFKEVVKKLKNNGAVVIFPEGGIPDVPGQDAKRGVGALARLGKAGVVPAYIDGTDRALPLGSWVLRPRRISVSFGSIMWPEGDDDRFASDVLDEIVRLGRDMEAAKYI